MFRIYLLGFFLFTCNISYAQWARLAEIKSATRDSSHKYYYPRLVEEFLAQPQYYSSEQGTFLYYGQIYSGYYKMFDFGKNQIDFNKFVERNRFSKAIPLGEKLLEENPVNLGVLLKLGYCYKKQNQPEKANLLQERAAVLFRAIETNGDGSEHSQAYKVISVSDEYLVMGKMGLPGGQRNSEQKDNSVFDIWEIKNQGSKETKKVYFEVLYNHDAVPK